jgi:hypothetical protein
MPPRYPGAACRNLPLAVVHVYGHSRVGSHAG